MNYVNNFANRTENAICHCVLYNSVNSSAISAENGVSATAPCATM